MLTGELCSGAVKWHRQPVLGSLLGRHVFIQGHVSRVCALCHASTYFRLEQVQGSLLERLVCSGTRDYPFIL